MININKKNQNEEIFVKICKLILINEEDKNFLIELTHENNIFRTKHHNYIMKCILFNSKINNVAVQDYLSGIKKFSEEFSNIDNGSISELIKDYIMTK